MKKIILLFLFLTCVFTLAACGQKSQQIVLPDISNIVSVDVTIGGSTVNHKDETWVSDMLSDISSSKKISKESVQDTPQVEDYIMIEIQFEKGASRLFAYEENGKYYIEQPYEGIYEIDSQLYERLQKNK